MFLFEIYTKPLAQKQTRYAKRGNSIHCYDPSAKDAEYIRWQIKPTAPEKPLTCAIETHFTFFMPIPKGTSKTKKLQMINRIILPSKKPDLDNMAYLITNALKGIVYQDDNQICVSHCYKYYGEVPKTIIKIYPIHTVEDYGYQEGDE